MSTKSVVSPMLKSLLVNMAFKPSHFQIVIKCQGHVNTGFDRKIQNTV